MYSDLDMSTNPNLSIWNTTPQTLVGYPAVKPMMTTEQVHSNSSTPEYSQSLSLETTMLSSCMNLSSTGLPTTVIAGNDTRHPVCVDPQQIVPSSSSSSSGSSSSVAPMRSINPRQGGRRNKSYVDPCEIAPLKKRRIQLELLNPDERDKILQKREKNKVAAEKCRVKRREKMQGIRVEYEEYLVANETLEADISRLQEERDKLEQLLKNHNCVLQQRV